MFLTKRSLKRFPITLEFDYTTKSNEKKILANVLQSLNYDCEGDLKQFSEDLVEWACITRKTFDEGAVDELISTRRLVHIINAFSILGKKDVAIKHCIARFDSEIRDSFFDLFTKVSSGEITSEEPVVEDVDVPKKEEDENPF